MLDLQEAAVRQRLSRARKQFQQLYALESSEQIGDKSSPSINPGMAQRHTSKHQNHEERVEIREAHDNELLDTPTSISRRSYGEQLYRNPAVTPLW